MTTTDIYVCFKNNIPFYVGKSVRIKGRTNDHKATYGKETEVWVIDTIETKHWKFWEKHYIQLFLSWGFDLKNKNRGGCGPTFYSDETKLMMSQNRTGKGTGPNPKLSEAKKGVPRDITWGDQISKAKTGSPKKGKSILQIDPITNKVINKFSSITEARRVMNNNGIPNALSGISKTSCGYIWRHEK